MSSTQAYHDLSLEPGASRSSPSLATLEAYLFKLTSMVHSISLIRHQTFPSLINNLQGPIQNINSQDNHLTPHQPFRSWSHDSQSIINHLQSLRHLAINSQDAMRYVRSSSKLDSRLEPEQKSSALHQTDHINQKNKLEYLISTRRPHSRSSIDPSNLLRNRFKIDPKTLRVQWIQRKTYRRSISSRSSFPQDFQSIRFETLEDCLQLLNRADRSDHLSYISPHEILLKGVMRVDLVFRSTDPSARSNSTSTSLVGPADPPDVLVERVFCFGLNEAKTCAYQSSSFGLIRSINRCINHIINQSLEFGIRSNLFMVCSLISSYNHFFTSEIASSDSKGPMSSETDHRQPSSHEPQSTSQTMPADHPNKPEHQRLKRPNESNSTQGSSSPFLTWRRWKFYPSYVLSRSEDLNPSRSDQDPPPAGLEQVLSQGRWIKTREIL